MTPIDDPAMEALARSFLLGTGRHPVAAGAAFQNLISEKGSIADLTALALVGQRLRFRRQGPPPQRSDRAPLEDPRPIVPDAARPLMRRLVGGRDGSGADLAARALADTCRRLRLRPHPFDLPWLPVFVRNYGEHLGAYAAAWTGRHEKSEDGRAGYLDADAIDSSNWTSARPAARVEFVAAMRGREPDRARQLVEASFAADPAPVRARLLGALVPGLSPADIPFLESLAKDRAPSVRERAHQLLTYIPGTASTESRLRDLLARTKLSTAGLLRRRKSLILELPANLQSVSPVASAAEAARSWAAAEYAGIGLDAMAAAFGLSVAEMIAAAADDAPLLALFARQASIERRLDVLATIVREHAADAWVDAIGTDGDKAPADGDGARVAGRRDDRTMVRCCARAGPLAHDALCRAAGATLLLLAPAQAAVPGARTTAVASVRDVGKRDFRAKHIRACLSRDCRAHAAAIAIGDACRIRRAARRRDVAATASPRLPDASRSVALRVKVDAHDSRNSPHCRRTGQRRRTCRPRPRR
jgi:hypothetical protein